MNMDLSYALQDKKTLMNEVRLKEQLLERSLRSRVLVKLVDKLKNC